MLLGLDARLTPDLLHALASMGHGDQLAIVDANFPATATAMTTPLGTPLEFGGTAIQALQAVLSVMPLDTFDAERPAVRAMQMVDQPDTLPEVVRDAVPLVRAAGQDIALTERFAFYAAARESFVIIHTLERRFYGNFLLRKGVIAPD